MGTCDNSNLIGSSYPEIFHIGDFLKPGVYLFNPSTEMALANDTARFTPRKQIIEFERYLSLLPALYCPAGSYIWAPHLSCISQACSLPYFDVADRKKLTILVGKQLHALHALPAPLHPWGWNKALCHDMLSCDPKLQSDCIPSTSELETLRKLASRKTTIEIWEAIMHNPETHEKMRQNMAKMKPLCIDEPEVAKRRIEQMQHPPVIKSPWSSSGRGVLIAGADHVAAARRAAQILNSQKEVMIEPLWDKALDFATEWECLNGEVFFCGFSLFKADNNGRYRGNLVASQQKIIQLIHAKLHTPALAATVNLLAEALKKVISPLYSGPLGVDMLADREGNINPCVEINMRFTMGHVALSLWDTIRKEFIFTPGETVLG